MNPMEHAVYQLRNAPLRKYPYPHFYATNVFPDDFYDALLSSLAPDEGYEGLKGGYRHRVAAKEQNPLIEPFRDPYFAGNVLGMFGQAFAERFPRPGKDGPKFSTDIRFIRDEEGYRIGPHTDAPNKVVSLLFYLPQDFSFSECGTSIYVPDDHKKTCPGGPHYKEEGFSEVWRAPFLPNSCFGFWKQNNSWHGVGEISRKIRRDVMLYNIYTDSESVKEQK
ncbi:hypothetical protein [Bradyrhizobium sp.]